MRWPSLIQRQSTLHARPSQDDPRPLSPNAPRQRLSPRRSQRHRPRRGISARHRQTSSVVLSPPPAIGGRGMSSASLAMMGSSRPAHFGSPAALDPDKRKRRGPQFFRRRVLTPSAPSTSTASRGQEPHVGDSTPLRWIPMGGEDRVARIPPPPLKNSLAGVNARTVQRVRHLGASTSTSLAAATVERCLRDGVVGEGVRSKGGAISIVVSRNDRRAAGRR